MNLFGPIFSCCGFPEGDATSVLVMLAIALLWTSAINHQQLDDICLQACADNWGWHTGQLPLATRSL